MYKCEKCNKEFKIKQSYQRHINKKIPCNRVIKCDNCNKVFKLMSHLTQHLNRKNKCIKVDLEQKVKDLETKLEITELKLENEKLKKSSNTTINNTQINIFTPEGKLYHSYFLKSNPLQQLEFDVDKLQNLTLEDYTDELSNIYNFTNLIQEICFNMNIPENWIICKDDLFDKLKLKIDKNNIVNCIDNILHLIYSIAKQVIDIKNLDNGLIKFYKTFIDKYENGEYKDNENVKHFIKLCNEELFKHFSKILNIISDKKNNIIKIDKEDIKLNNFGEEDIRFIKKSVIDMELNSILEKQYPEKVYNNSCIVNEFRYYGIMDVKMIDMFIYFLRIIYNNDEQMCNKTIQYKEDKFYIYRNGGWVVIKSKDLVNQIFTKIHLILKLNKIKLIEGVYTEDYVIETFKEKYTIHYTIGDVKKYSKILIEYFKDNNAFVDHEKHIIS